MHGRVEWLAYVLKDVKLFQFGPSQTCSHNDSFATQGDGRMWLLERVNLTLEMVMGSSTPSLAERRNALLYFIIQNPRFAVSQIPNA